MAAEDFADDTKDGGEIGAGHNVTVLYEIALLGSEQELPEIDSKYSRVTVDDNATGDYLTVNIRYKAPNGDTSTLIEKAVDGSVFSEKMSENMSWAAGVAQAGMLIRKSEYEGTSNMDDVIGRLSELECTREDDYRKEFCELMKKVVID